MSAQQSTVLFAVPAHGVARRDLRAFVQRLRTEVAGEACFDVLITSDGELQRLNREFRKKNYPTDVLSFPLEDGGALLGELAISFERAAAQAAEHGHETADEVRILILHGLLHLLGMDHERDSGAMARAENKWRKHFGLPAGLIERVRA